ncbi:DUF1961 family protein [Paenibacillus rhizoplanae]
MAQLLFPQGRLRLESTRGAEEGQKANVVFWCPEVFFRRSLPSPGGSARCASRGWPFCSSRLRVPGGKDLFDPSLPVRTGEYDQYHHGEMDAYHISYFRRMWEEERAFSHL